MAIAQDRAQDEMATSKEIVNLRGSTVLLTGASRGIGAILAARLAAAGVHLVLAARDAAKLEAVRERCATVGAPARVVVADVSRPLDRELLAREAGEIDALINNAAVETPVAFLDQSQADIAAQIDTNLVAPIELTRLLLPGMLARRRGVIVNVSSMSGKVPTPFNTIYAATKYGLNGFSASLRLELEGSGVHVGTVCPSFVGETGMWVTSGGRAPARMPEVAPEKVVQGVFAVLGGASEVLVTARPIRSLLALREVFPGIEGPVMRRMGVIDAFRQRAETRKAGL
jgi:short-subunit dehydrogenase